MLTMELTLAERIDACDSLIKYFKGDINEGAKAIRIISRKFISFDILEAELDYKQIMVIPSENLVPIRSSAYCGNHVDKAKELADIYGNSGLVLPLEVKPDSIVAELMFMKLMLLMIQKKPFEIIPHIKMAYGAFIQQHVMSWVPQYINRVINSANTELCQECAKSLGEFVQYEYNEAMR